MIIESYKINDSRYTIEDMGDGELHIWHSGCGLGIVTSMQEARRKIYNHALAIQMNAQDRAEQELVKIKATLKWLEKGDLFYLGVFLDKEDSE